MLIRFLITLFLGINIYANDTVINYIDAKNINVRSSASIGDNIIFRLHNGAQNIKIINEIKGEEYRWVEVEFSDKQRGWVVSDYIKSIKSNFSLAFYEQIDDLYRLRVWYPITGRVDEVFTIENSADNLVAYRKDATAGKLLLHLDREKGVITVTNKENNQTVFKVENIIDAYWISDYKNLKSIKGHVLVW